MKTRIETLPLNTLRKQEINARFMTGVQFRQLVSNIKKDGALTSVPLVHQQQDGGYKILSGHHRIAAAIEAGISEAPCMVIEEDLSRDQEVALVLSHNSLSGQDDPATLLRLYEEIETTSWKQFAGLDDKTLALLEQVQTDTITEASLDFATVQLVFLPHEKEAAERALREAKAAAQNADEQWIAPWRDYERTLDALETVQESHTIGNTATAFAVILATFENHVDELQAGWSHDPFTPPKKDKTVPMETVFGSRRLLKRDAATILQATRRAKKNGDLSEESPWEFITMLATNYLDATT